MPRPSYASVAATLALVVALGGTAYAAGLPRNSVGSPQIKNGAVRSVDIKDGAVTGQDVRESSLGTVPDAARLGGVAAGGYARRASSMKGAFTIGQPLAVSVPGYGTFSMTCDNQSPVDAADDRVSYAWNQVALGSGATVQATQTFATGIGVTGNTQLARSVAAASSFGGANDSMGISALHESANGDKGVLVSAWGFDDFLVDGCQGSIVAQVLR